MKVSNDFSGALRTFAYFMTSGTHYMLKEVDYLDLYGNDPSAIEMAYAIFANVLEMDSDGNVLNFKYAQRRATDYIKSYCDPTFDVSPPFEEWEMELYGPPDIEDTVQRYNKLLKRTQNAWLVLLRRKVQPSIFRLLVRRYVPPQYQG